jgi:glycosyltransferase involved in cell wall biosynthesis
VKVLHVIPSVSPALGGPSHVVLNLVKALRDCGIDAEIATTNDNGSTLLDVPLNERIEYEQVPIWFLPRFSPPMKEFIFSAALTRWLMLHIRDYDIIETHYLFSYASTCAGAIARWQGVPYIVRTIGQMAPWALAQSQLKKQIYTFLIERHNLNSAAAIHCTCAGEAEDVRKFGIKTPTITLPLGVDRPTISAEAKQKLRQIYGIPSTTPVVLFLSRLHYKSAQICWCTR